MYEQELYVTVNDRLRLVDSQLITSLKVGDKITSTSPVVISTAFQDEHLDDGSMLILEPKHIPVWGFVGVNKNEHSPSQSERRIFINLPKSQKES